MCAQSGAAITEKGPTESDPPMNTLHRSVGLYTQYQHARKEQVNRNKNNTHRRTPSYWHVTLPPTVCPPTIRRRRAATGGYSLFGAGAEYAAVMGGDAYLPY
jgi:hypothetical protein